MTTPTHEEMCNALRWQIEYYQGLHQSELRPLNHSDALRAALAELEAQRWRPIEEAPKDEEIALLGSGGKKLCGPIGYEPTDDSWFWINGLFKTKPTHWRPLPEPPSDN